MIDSHLLERSRISDIPVSVGKDRGCCGAGQRGNSGQMEIAGGRDEGGGLEHPVGSGWVVVVVMAASLPWVRILNRTHWMSVG